ncbi:hypothetical protein, partial [Pseudomonas sp. ML96]|uniref:hypothetical protein n=1 Tax=Pseudomonas sp. ML96 TaxID=1523503 RepID=UPI001C45EDB2
SYPQTPIREIGWGFGFCAQENPKQKITRRRESILIRLPAPCAWLLFSDCAHKKATSIGGFFIYWVSVSCCCCFALNTAFLGNCGLHRYDACLFVEALF